MQHVGYVSTGKGEAVGATALPWFQEALKSRFGFRPFPGTLNLEGVSEDGALATHLLEHSMVLVPPTPGFCCSLLTRVSLRSNGVKPGEWVPAVLVRPMVPGYGTARAEFVAPLRLRDALGAQDGDSVDFRVEVSAFRPSWTQGSQSEGDSVPGVARGRVVHVLSLTDGPFTLVADWTATESGLVVTLVGGHTHVGAVALATPRPSLRDHGKLSATSSVLTLPGHKDDNLARTVSERLAAALGQPITVSAGVHIGPPGSFVTPLADIEKVGMAAGTVADLVREQVAGRFSPTGPTPDH